MIGICAVAFSVSVIAGASLGNRLDSDKIRDARSKPFKVIEFAGVERGDNVLDLLGGSGYYTHLLSKKVGEKGSVTLHNNQAYIPYVKKDLDARFAKNKLPNVKRLMSEVADLRLGENKFDKAFFVMGYHDLYYSNEKWDVTADKLLPQLNKSMKKGGKLLIVDHRAEKGTGKKSAQVLHRIEPEFVINDLKTRGFKLIDSTDILENKADPLNIIAFDKSLKRNTSRFVLLFEKVN